MAKKKKSEIIENNEVETDVVTENDKLNSYSDEAISNIVDSHIAEDLVDTDKLYPVNDLNLETATESTDEVITELAYSIAANSGSGYLTHETTITKTSSIDEVKIDISSVPLDVLNINYEDTELKLKQLENLSITAVQPESEYSITIESEIENLITKIQIRQEMKPWYYNQLIEGLLKDILKLEKQRP